MERGVLLDPRWPQLLPACLLAPWSAHVVTSDLPSQLLACSVEFSWIRAGPSFYLQLADPKSNYAKQMFLQLRPCEPTKPRAGGGGGGGSGGSRREQEWQVRKGGRRGTQPWQVG